MTWTCPHWVDLYTAWVSGICGGVVVGIVLGIALRSIETRRIFHTSQGGSDGSTF